MKPANILKKAQTYRRTSTVKVMRIARFRITEDVHLFCEVGGCIRTLLLIADFGLSEIEIEALKHSGKLKNDNYLVVTAQNKVSIVTPGELYEQYSMAIDHTVKLAPPTLTVPSREYVNIWTGGGMQK